MLTVIKSNNKQDAVIKSTELVKAWVDKTDKTYVKATTNISTEADINSFVSGMTETLSTNWWKYFAAYNPQPVLQKLKCPVLALNGSADIQVPAAENLNAIESILKKAANKNFAIHKFDGLNHLFQKCSKCTVAEYGQLENTIEPEVLETIGDWLTINVFK